MIASITLFKPLESKWWPFLNFQNSKTMSYIRKFKRLSIELKTAKLMPELDPHGRVVIKSGSSTHHWPMKKRYINGQIRQETPQEVFERWKVEKQKRVDEAQYMAQFEGLTTSEIYKHPKFSHYRVDSYRVIFYVRNPWSPTGVVSFGGCSKEQFSKM